MSWKDAFDANYTDGIIVLHHGRVVYERYDGCLGPDTLHGAMSITKPLTGLLGEILVAEGKLNEAARVGSLIPELKNSAFGDATVRQVMDMTTALDYYEDYADPNAEVWTYADAGSPLPKPAGYTGPRSYFEFCRPSRRKARMARHLATRPSMPMRWAGRLPAPPENQWRRSCPSASGAVSAPSARFSTPWTPWARLLPATALTLPCVTWPGWAS